MISVQHTPSYDPAVIQAAVDRHFELLDLDRLIPREGKITVKPNLLMKRRPEDGTTTHPALVEAVIRRVQKVSNAQITIADSPGGPFTKQALEGIYRASGMEEVAKKTGAVLNYDVGSTHIPNPEGKLCKAFDLINPIAEADFIVSICKLKSHCMTGAFRRSEEPLRLHPGADQAGIPLALPGRKEFLRWLLDPMRHGEAGRSPS